MGSTGVISSSEQDIGMLFTYPSNEKKIDFGLDEPGIYIDYVVVQELVHDDTKTALENAQYNLDHKVGEQDFRWEVVRGQSSDYIYSYIWQKAKENQLNMLLMDIKCISKDRESSSINKFSVKFESLGSASKPKSIFYLTQPLVSLRPEDDETALTTVVLRTRSGQELGKFELVFAPKKHCLKDLLFEALCMYEGKVASHRVASISCEYMFEDVQEVARQESRQNIGLSDAFVSSKISDLEVEYDGFPGSIITGQFTFMVGGDSNNDVQQNKINNSNRENGRRGDDNLRIDDDESESDKTEATESNNNDTLLMAGLVIICSVIGGIILYFSVDSFRRFVNNLLKVKEEKSTK